MKSRRYETPAEMTVHKAFKVSITDMLLNVGMVAILLMVIWPK
jgi:hypothetical protein